MNCNRNHNSRNDSPGDPGERGRPRSDQFGVGELWMSEGVTVTQATITAHRTGTVS